MTYHGQRKAQCLIHDSLDCMLATAAAAFRPSDEHETTRRVLHGWVAGSARNLGTRQLYGFAVIGRELYFMPITANQCLSVDDLHDCQWMCKHKLGGFKVMDKCILFYVFRSSISVGISRTKTPNASRT
jgi:hypothetical protein